jgi:ATP-binding cassette, subfamily C, bacterial CydC
VIRALRRLLGLARAGRARVLASAGLGALTVLLGVGLMATAGWLIARASEQPPVLSLTVAIVGVRFFGIGRPLSRYVERVVSHDLALRSLTGARARVWDRLVPLAPAQLEGYRRGDLLSRMVADVDALQNLHLRGVGPPIAAVLAGAGACAAAAIALPAAGLVLAAGLLVAGAAVPPVGVALARRSSRRQAAARGALSADLVEVLDTAPELVAYGADDVALERLRAADRAIVRLARRDAFAGGLADGLMLAVTGATVAGVLAVAVDAVAAGTISPVLVAMLGLLALAAFDAVTPLAAAARELSATVAAGRRVLEITDRPVAVTDHPVPVAVPAWPFEVALEDVRVRYPAATRPALDGVTLRLAPGARVALVGPSGAGKTTVASLLLRFVDPAGGRVALGGRDVRDLRQDDVRAAVAVAGQDAHLFAASIRANVCLARPDAPDGDVEDALRRARLLDWVRGLPDGWDTRVGEDGRELSGGQRQRIVLARALLADRPVLVLDEPTAHLDPETAEALVRDVLDAAGDRTVLLITHRPEGLALVDEIVTLDAGRVAAATA